MNELKIIESKLIMKISSWFSGSKIIGTQVLFWLFVHDAVYWNYQKKHNSKKWVHENIHFAQGKELLFVFFWLFYASNYLINLIRFKFDKKKSYEQIVFEIEAYTMEYKKGYLSKRKLYSWTKWVL